MPSKLLVHYRTCPRQKVNDVVIIKVQITCNWAANRQQSIIRLSLRRFFKFKNMNMLYDTINFELLTPCLSHACLIVHKSIWITGRRHRPLRQKRLPRYCSHIKTLVRGWHIQFSIIFRVKINIKLSVVTLKHPHACALEYSEVITGAVKPFLRKFFINRPVDVLANVMNIKIGSFGRCCTVHHISH